MAISCSNNAFNKPCTISCFMILAQDVPKYPPRLPKVTPRPDKKAPKYTHIAEHYPKVHPSSPRVLTLYTHMAPKPKITQLTADNIQHSSHIAGPAECAAAIESAAANLPAWRVKVHYKLFKPREPAPGLKSAFLEHSVFV